MLSIKSENLMEFIMSVPFFYGAFFAGLFWGIRNFCVLQKQHKLNITICIYCSIIASMFGISFTVIAGDFFIELLDRSMFKNKLTNWNELIFTIMILIIGQVIRRIIKSLYGINDKMLITNMIFWGGILSVFITWIIDQRHLMNVFILLLGRII